MAGVVLAGLVAGGGTKGWTEDLVASQGWIRSISSWVQLENIMNQTCKAKTKAGNPCKAIPFAKGLCAFHVDPNRAAQLGRMGGQKNRRIIPDSASEAISIPRTAEAVTNLLAETMAGIHARRLDPKIGNVMAYLGTALLNAFETAELERRIADLEKRTAVPADR
jgi:hypothetical protein